VHVERRIFFISEVFEEEVSKALLVLMYHVGLEFSVGLSDEAEIAGGIPVPVASDGLGTAEIEYDPNVRTLRWNFTLEQLTSNVTQLHFHGPARRLETGPLQVRTLREFGWQRVVIS